MDQQQLLGKNKRGFWSSLCSCCLKKNGSDTKPQSLDLKRSSQSTLNPLATMIGDRPPEEDLIPAQPVKGSIRPAKREYPKNKPFLLQSSKRKRAIVAKVTERFFRIQSKSDLSSDHKSVHQHVRKDCSSIHEDWDDDCYNHPTPKALARYQAQRISGTSLVIDLCCGKGGNLIQFAKECEFVIGVESNSDSIEQARELCRMQRVEEKVDFIWANCLQIKNLTADVVFLNPTVKGTNLYTDCNPPLQNLIEKAFQIAPSLMVLLPFNVDITQLPQIFSKAFQTINNPTILQQDYAIEIEEIYLNSKPEYLIIYYGSIAQFTHIEVLEFLNVYLLRTGADYNGIDMNLRLLDILAKANKKIGQYNLIRFCHQAQQFSTLEQTIFQSFLNQLISSGIIDEDQLRRSFKSHGKTSEDLESSKQKQQTSFASHQEQQESVPLQVTLKKKQVTQTPYDEKIISPNEFSLEENSEQFNPSYGVNRYKLKSNSCETESVYFEGKFSGNSPSIN